MHLRETQPSEGKLYMCIHLSIAGRGRFSDLIFPFDCCKTPVLVLTCRSGKLSAHTAELARCNVESTCLEKLNLR